LCDIAFISEKMLKLWYSQFITTRSKTQIRQDMKEKTVVITGATSGLGRATALQLAQKGAFVLIIARSNTKANEIIKEIKKEGGKGQFIISEQVLWGRTKLSK
jgi:NAD(P)-dependent dehydrogenase (short-subunit alcohol dehydrogenase family)